MEERDQNQQREKKCNQKKKKPKTTPYTMQIEVQ